MAKHEREYQWQHGKCAGLILVGRSRIKLLLDIHRYTHDDWPYTDI